MKKIIFVLFILTCLYFAISFFNDNVDNYILILLDRMVHRMNINIGL